LERYGKGERGEFKGRGRMYKYVPAGSFSRGTQISLKNFVRTVAKVRLKKEEGRRRGGGGRRRSTVDSFWSGAADSAEDYFVFEGAEDYHAEFHYNVSELPSKFHEKVGKGKEKYH
jgi:hypothetical protein